MTHPKSAEEIWKESKSAIAKQYQVGTTLVMGHREKYWNEAALSAMHTFAEVWLVSKANETKAPHCCGASPARFAIQLDQSAYYCKYKQLLRHNNPGDIYF